MSTAASKSITDLHEERSTHDPADPSSSDW